MKCFVIAATFTALLAHQAPAAQMSYSAQNLYDDCTSGDRFRLGVCGGFMSGVLETLEAYHVICIPAGVSGPDVGYWVTTYATNNKADLPGHNAVDLVFSALKAKWLC
jgi:hypothetical protein